MKTVKASIEMPVINSGVNVPIIFPVGSHMTLLYLGEQNLTNLVKSPVDEIIDRAMYKYFRVATNFFWGLKNEELFGPDNTVPVYTLHDPALAFSDVRDQIKRDLQKFSIIDPGTYSVYRPHITIPHFDHPMPASVALGYPRLTLWK